MRSRRPFFIAFVVLLFLAILARHGRPLSRILAVYAFWRNPLITTDIDSTFAPYPVKQWSASWPPQPVDPDSPLLRLANGSFSTTTDDFPDLVPPIMHHILLGKSDMPIEWQISRQACLDLHPNYTHHFWSDTNALSFMSANYPWFVQRWQSYKYPIQRADSLRYFLLHHFGGIFLDLDLQCLRSLGPLRKFPVVSISAKPVGVSNGFMMAEPQHPFFGQLVSALDDYDRTWFWIPYVAVMFSTGPMFLSAEHFRFTSLSPASPLKVIVEPFHRLSGRVITPLFRHGGSSSWHNDDAKLLRHFARAPLFIFLILLGVLIAVWFVKSRYSSASTSKAPYDEDETELLPTWSPNWLESQNNDTSDDAELGLETNRK